jgi:hypothetical protein
MAHPAPWFRLSGLFLVLAWTGLGAARAVAAETGIGWRVWKHADLTKIVQVERKW